MRSPAESLNLKKYAGGNPALRYLIGRFQARCARLLDPLPVASALEVGCGEGFLLRFLVERYPGWDWAGRDLSAAAIEYARGLLPAKVELAVGDVYALDLADRSRDLVIASEVLEHLDDPAAGMRELARVARRFLLLSVPNEPLFRLSNFLRGKYLRHWGDHPEHVQHWRPAAFRAFAGGYGTVRAAAASYPWTIVLLEKRTRGGGTPGRARRPDG